MIRIGHVDGRGDEAKDNEDKKKNGHGSTPLSEDGEIPQQTLEKDKENVKLLFV